MSKSGQKTSPMRLRALGGVAASLMLGAAAPASLPDTDWKTWGGEPGFSHYSDLAQITPGNVGRLQVAWTYDVGPDTSLSSPLVVGNQVFLVGAGQAIVALEAATGREIWKRPGLAARGVRGLTYWASADRREQRIFYFKDNFMRALDARTGAPIEGYAVDLRQGVDRDPETINQIQSNAPSTVFGDLIITGALTGEEYGSPPGDIRAFDARTGRNVWIFRPLPRDGEPGSETWPKNARSFLGGANNWTGMSLDARRGILYAVTGSSTYDFWGADRPGNNLYANSLLAIDARNGRLLWHFQAVHHDLWDWDFPTPPVLVTVKHGGRTIDAVVAAGKTGFLYAFDRVTGKPLWPIEERLVPTRGVEGEWVSPTQPFPTRLKPFARQSFTAADIDPGLPATEREELAARLSKARNEGMFTPPDVIDTVLMPGALGATNWGMLSGDPKKGMAYVISSEMPSIIRMAVAQPLVVTGATPFERGQSIYSSTCAGCHGADRRGSESFPSLVDITRRLPRDAIQQVVQRGRGHMPAFPHVREGYMADMTAFLANDRSVGPGAAPTAKANPANPPIPRWRSDYGLMTSLTTKNPVIRPPWSQVTAYDLNTGDIAWQRPIGTDRNYKAAIDGPTGLFGRVGSALTAGGLMFVATGRDRTLHALDLKTGKTVWTGPLPAEPAGLPSVYAAGGRQFILVPAANSRPAGPGELPPRNAFVAFALPATR